MRKSKIYADIVLPLPLQDLYTYAIPSDLRKNVSPGMRVTIQFGKKKLYTGLVRKVHAHTPAYETKEIISVLDQKPIVEEFHFQFWEWIAQYYMCTLGEVYKAALPSGLKLESESLIVLNDVEDVDALTDDEKLAVNILKNEQIIKIEQFHKIMNETSSLNVIKSLLDKKVITIIERLRESYKPKTEKYIRLAQEFSDEFALNEVLKKLQKAPGQFNMLMNFLNISGFFNKDKQEVRQADLIKESGLSVHILRPLLKKNILEKYEKEVSRIKDDAGELKLPHSLNEEQSKALESIKKSFIKQDVTLLHGVTSSGKTEIYIHLIAETIKQGKQVLYLLPEIALTTQIINRLKRIFGNLIGVYHSKFSDSDRVETWNKISNDEDCQIILGVRSSVFLPFRRLGLVIIDEEHENTYKQFDPAPRYNARDSAIYLAKMLGIRVLMGTATPSIENYYNCLSGKYGLVEMHKRYLDIQMPEIVIADTREARKSKRMNGHFSATMIKYIDEAIDNNEQVILFQNRRGFSPFIECETCGWIPKCTRCDVSLTYHKGLEKMVCHYCGLSRKVPDKCDACGNVSLRTKGFGTEKIEEDIQLLYSNKVVARLDLDTTRSRKSYEKIIGEFETKEIDILIGTQMVSKGLDFDNVSLVGILNADNMLHYPDFRSYERSFQLMSQVSGRAGRRNKQGLVVIQTSDKNHFIIRCVKNNDYQAMYKSQIEERKKFRYPPFYRIVKILIKHKDKTVVTQASDYFAKNLRSVFGARVLGPEYPVVARIQNNYMKQIILKIERTKSTEKAKELLQNEINRVKSHEQYKSVQVVTDVDPM